jgi:uncharacterized protein DUF4446
VPDELTSTEGVIALVAGGLALLALLLLALLARRVRRLQAAQQSVLGEGGQRDLVQHAHTLQEGFDALRAHVERTFAALDERLVSGERRLDGCLSRSAVIRYDAYGEMSGRQSSSMALLDDTGSGVVMTSILHREQARTYVKGVREGNPEIELSPEEEEAVQTALGRSKEAAAAGSER